MEHLEIRRRNLLKIRNERCGGSTSELANRIGRDLSFVSRMLYPPEKKHRKTIGDKIVLDIEEAFNLPRGWLDGLMESEDQQRVLTQREVVLLDLFGGMPESEQTKIIQQLTDKKEHYDELLKELLEARGKAV